MRLRLTPCETATTLFFTAASCVCLSLSWLQQTRSKDVISKIYFEALSNQTSDFEALKKMRAQTSEAYIISELTAAVLFSTSIVSWFLMNRVKRITYDELGIDLEERTCDKVRGCFTHSIAVGGMLVLAGPIMLLASGGSKEIK